MNFNNRIEESRDLFGPVPTGRRYVLLHSIGKIHQGAKTGYIAFIYTG